jgi:ribosomal protein L12E/L44/L45/RPP1/RPP2
VLRMAGLDDVQMDIEQARLLRSLADLHEKRLAAHEALEQAAASLGSAARSPGRVAGGAAVGAHAAARRGSRAR